jgi:hypothetical protein
MAIIDLTKTNNMTSAEQACGPFDIVGYAEAESEAKKRLLNDAKHNLDLLNAAKIAADSNVIYMCEDPKKEFIKLCYLLEIDNNLSIQIGDGSIKFVKK